MEWQPIETAPKDCGEILAWDGEYTLAVYLEGEWWPCLSDEQPTHWMPLPTPPTNKGKTQ